MVAAVLPKPKKIQKPPRGILFIKSEIPSEQIAKFKEEWRKQVSSVQHRWRQPVIDAELVEVDFDWEGS